MDAQSIQAFFAPVAGQIDPQAVIENYLAVQDAYAVDKRKLPLPVWARRGLSDKGAQAWRTIQADMTHYQNENGYCIYLHVPFCKEKCVFCDCYSFRLANHPEAVIEKYLKALDLEMQAWNSLGILQERRLSTVHLGGGTPTFLGLQYFPRLVKALRAKFPPNAQTEWALESTSSELDEDMLALMDDLGFTRLHVGVQSLQDPARQVIARRETGATVLKKLEKAIRMGWVVSVDLICGLPHQTVPGWLDDLTRLAQAGVDGFSIYELQVTSRNRRFAQNNGLLDADRTERYLYFQAAEQHLSRLGYHKSLFNHFARQRDANLYFTFPERGEDCLALGTIADGILGDYHFRHPEYKQYLDTTTAFFPGLQGGARQTPFENALRPLETALLSGKISQSGLAAVLGPTFSAQLLEGWHNAKMIDPGGTGAGQYGLTANGSWFVGEMMAQVASVGRQIFP